MKNLKEKQLLVNLAKALGQKADEEVIKELKEFDRIKTEARKTVKKDPLSYIAEAAAKIENLPKKDTPEYPLPPSLDELEEMLKDVPELKPEEKIEVKEVEEQSLIEKTAKFISEAPKESFQQPEPPKTNTDIQSIVNKLRYLEQWMAKVSMEGPGSGETKFRFLDDVDRDTIGNTDQILRYRPESPTEYGKFFFGNLSGDQGPIRSMQYDTNGPGPNASVGVGLVAWNSAEDCLNVYQTNTVLQVGLENYIRVHNHSGNTIPNGTFVQFAGVDLGVDAPLVIPFRNDGNTQPLYSVGVLTEDLHHNSTGKATTLGLIRDVDTSGNVVGESWQIGDILWAHPNIPGELTRVKPAAPNVALSVGAVMEVSDSAGQLLIRPTIWPRLHYGTFTRATDQFAPNVNYGHAIQFSDTDSLSGFELLDNSKIVAKNSGRYQFDVNLQYRSTNSSTVYLWSWTRINGQDIPRSTYKVTAESNKAEAVLFYNFQRTLYPGEYLQVMFAVSSTDLHLSAPAGESFCPATPSVIVNVTEVAL